MGEFFNHLTNVIGPRLTGSPAYKQAVDWSAAQLRHLGLANVHTETWPFGRGWTLERLTLEITGPGYFPLIGYAEAWTPSTSRHSSRTTGSSPRTRRSGCGSVRRPTWGPLGRCSGGRWGR